MAARQLINVDLEAAERTGQDLTDHYRVKALQRFDEYVALARRVCLDCYRVNPQQYTAFPETYCQHRTPPADMGGVPPEVAHG